MKKIGSLIISLMLIIMSRAWGLDWSMYRADTSGTSYTAEVAYPPLAAQWSYETFSPITASPIVANNTIFVGNHVGMFYAISAYGSEAEVLWQYESNGRIDSTACYNDGIVYFASRNGYVYAVNSDDGSLVWSKDIDTTIISSPIILGDNLYIGAGSTSSDVIVINAVSGQTVGTLSTSQPVQSSVCMYNGSVYVTSNDGALYSFDTTTLGQNWSYASLGSFEQSSPLATTDGVFISPGNDEKKIYRISLAANNKLDESNVITDALAVNRTSSPGFYNNVVYVSMCADLSGLDLSFKMYALDATDLTNELWNYNFGVITGADSFGNMSITRNCVYTATFDGKLLAFLQSDGSSSIYDNTISINSIQSQPTISNGWVYVGLMEGTVKAFKADAIVSIVSPRSNEIISATTTVKGTVIHDDLLSYTLSYGEGSSPSSWIDIISKQVVIDQANIADWGLAGLSDGVYTLKLSAVTSPASSIDLNSLVSVTVNAPPEPPTGVLLTELSNTYTLSWTLSADDGDSDNDVTLYYIYRSTTAGSYSSVFDSVSSGINFYSDTTVVPNTQYYYIIKARDGLNVSSQSNEVQNTVTTQTQWEEISVATGGEVDLPDGTKVIFLPGTFDENVFVQINVKQQGEFTDPGDTLLLNGTNIVREFNALTAAQLGALTSTSVSEQDALLKSYASSSVTFKKPATIVIAYGVNEITGLDPSKLSIAEWNEETSQWINNNTSQVDTDSQYVECAVNHFSLFRVVENPWVKITYTAGGSTQLVDGTKATVPANTFAEDNWVYIRTLSAGDYNNTGLPAQYKAASIDRRFYTITDTQMDAAVLLASSELESQIKSYSTAMSFNHNITIDIPYAQEDIVGMNPKKLRILMFDESDAQWKIVNTSVSDPDNLKVTAQVSHFTDYQIAEFVPYGDLLEKDKVYTYPNPATGNTLTFKYFTGNDAFITIDVYNVAGERVAHLAGQGQAGLVNEIEWNIRRYASGIYLYIIEAKQMDGNSKKKIVKKLAIIH